MAKIMNDNFQINVGNPIDSKYLNSSNQPYTNSAAVLAAIPQSQRYIGLTVNVANVEWWFYNGVTDGDFQIKDSGLASTGITAARNGLTKSGNAVLLGGALTGNTVVNSGSAYSLTLGDPGYTNTLFLNEPGYNGTSIYSDCYIYGNAADAVNGFAVSELKRQGCAYTWTQSSGTSRIDLYSNRTIDGGGGSSTGIRIDGQNNFACTYTRSGCTYVNVAPTCVDIKGLIKVSTVPSTGGVSDYILVRAADGTVKQVAGTSLGAITGATNGLTKVGQKVVLGGALTGNTTISVPSGLVYKVSGGSTTSTYTCATNVNEIATNNLDLQAGPGAQKTEIALFGGIDKIALTTSGSTSTGAYVLIDGTLPAPKICAGGKIFACTTPTVGTVSNDVLTRDTVTGEIKTLSVATITGATAISAVNGLTKTGNQIKLGGTLTGTTTITDSRGTPVGIQYGADYSPNFTLESLTSWRTVVTVPPTTQTGSFTLALTDLGDAIVVTSATPVNITIPTNASVPFPIGSMITIQQGGVGTVTAVPASGVTLTGVELSTTKQYSFVQYWKTGTNAWSVIGGAVELWEVNGNVLTPVDTNDRIPVTYISGLTGALGSFISGATNGLTKSGQQVKLGGTLTGNTNIGVSTYKFRITGNTNSAPFGICYAHCSDGYGVSPAIVIGDGYCNGAIGDHVLAVTSGRTCATQVCGTCCAAISLDPTALIVTTNNSVGNPGGALYIQNTCALIENTNGTSLSSLKISGNVVEIGGTGPAFAGAQYCADYSTNFTNRSLVDKEYVDSAAGGIGASNGLTRVDNNITLGGTLTGNTIINRDGKNFCISGSGGTDMELAVTPSTIYLGDWWNVSEHYYELNKYQHDLYVANSGQTQYSSFVIGCDGGYNNTTVWSTCNQSNVESSITLGLNRGVPGVGGVDIVVASGGTCTYLETSHNRMNVCTWANPTFKGVQYDCNYGANFTARSIPDAAWVTGRTSTSGIHTAVNGLTKSGTEVKLGGSITGTTMITASTHTNCLLINAPFCACDTHVIGFHVDPTVTGWKEGRLYYQNNNLNFEREYSGVTLQIGEEQVIKVVNQTGALIPNGAAVYVTGATGAYPKIAKSIASVSAVAENTLGMTTMDIPDNGEGYVTINGLVRCLNTSSFAAGSRLYLSPTIAGCVTTTEPVYPNSAIHIGYVICQSASVGTVLVQVDNETPYTSIGTFNAYTASTNSSLNNKLACSVFNTYTGNTATCISYLDCIADRALTGATNGLTSASRVVCLGGALTTPTTISGTQSLTLGDLNGITLSTANVNDIHVNSKSGGGVYIKSQSGTITTPNSFTNAVGFAMDYDSLGGFAIYDCRVGSNAVGIQYAADYSDNYVNRSLVDKAYVDSVATGLNVHGAVTVATTGNTTRSGLTTIDGVTITTGMRILVKNQTNGALNGIYTGSTGVWGRASDYDFTPSGEVTNGDLIPVLSGNTNANSQWILVTPNPIVSGDTLTYSKFSQQQGIIAGNGICATTVGANCQIAVKLSSTASGLSFDGTALELDWMTFRNGLCACTATGKVDVRATVGSASGTEISVRINTGGTNVLYVDSAAVVTALGTPVTGGTNGLTKAGANIKLGGTLCEDTSISGNAGTYDLSLTSLDSFNLGFDNVSTITDGGTNGGLRYAADYSANYVDRSLVDKGFVNNAITGSTLTYNNGLTKLGKVISWGGTLTGATQVIFGSDRLCMGSGFMDMVADCSRVHVDNTSLCLQSCTLGTCVGSVCIDNTGAIKLNTNNATLPICVTSPNAMKYAGDYSSTFTARSIPDAAWVTGKTSTAGLQTANNGLNKAGTNVRLGGNLTGNTLINIAGKNLAISGNTNLIFCATPTDFTIGDYYLNGCGWLVVCTGCTSVYHTDGPNNSGWDVQADGYQHYYARCGSYLDEIILNSPNVDSKGICMYARKSGCGNTYINIQSGATIIGSGLPTFQGATYCADYGANFVARSLVDAAWVTGRTACAVKTALVAVTGATNGLTKYDNHNVCLGGVISSGNSVNIDMKGSSLFQIGCTLGYNFTGGTIRIGGIGGTPQLQNVRIGFNDPAAQMYSQIGLYDGSMVFSAASGATQKAVCMSYDSGLQYYFDYSSSNLTNPRWIPDKAYVDGIGGAGITNASNGLTKVGQNVTLGGFLTGSTCIDLCLNDFCLVHTGLVYQDEISFKMDAQNNNICLGIRNISGCTSVLDLDENQFSAFSQCPANFQGFTYVGGFNATVGNKLSCSIPDLGYVTGLTSQGITTANNGLSYGGQNVVLGGTLTGNTIVCSDNKILTFSGSSGGVSSGMITEYGCSGFFAKNSACATLLASCTCENILMSVDGSVPALTCISQTPQRIQFSGLLSTFSGATYDQDYSVNYGCLSIPHVGWVTGKTSTSGIQTASNGLNKVGQNVALGGPLTGITCINLNGSGLYVNESTLNSWMLWADESTDSVGLSSVTGSEQVAIDGINQCIDIGTVSAVIKVIEAGSGVISASTAGNGTYWKLDDLNQLVALESSNGSIMIDGGNNCITINSVNAGCLCLDANNFCNIFTDPMTLKGLEYAGDYSANFTQYSLVDVNYVTGVTSQGITSADNGLTKSGSVVALGGTLTGNTFITLNGSCLFACDANFGLFLDANNSQACIGDSTKSIYTSPTLNLVCQDDGAGNYSEFCQSTLCNGLHSTDGASNTVIYQSPTCVCITGDTGINIIFDSSNDVIRLATATPSTSCVYISSDYANITAGAGVSAAFTKASCEVQINAGTFCIYMNGATGLGEFTSNSTDNGMTIDNGNDVVDIRNNDGSVVVRVGSTSVDLFGTVCLASTPNDGTTSDAVLVWDSSSNEVHKVPGSSLGDKNNIYAMTVVSTNTTLTTGSTYVILVSGATLITLPATPINGQVFRIKDAINNATTNNITIARNGKLIDYAANNALINTDGGALELVYNNQLGSWYVFSWVN